MPRVLPLLLHLSQQLSALGCPCVLPAAAPGPWGARVVPALEAELSHQELSHGIWGTSQPSMCSDPLSHAHQDGSGGSSGGSSCCDKVGPSHGQCPPPEMPPHPRGGSQRRGAGWGQQCFSRESRGTEQAGDTSETPQGDGGCRGSPSHCLRAALSFPVCGN